MTVDRAKEYEDYLKGSAELPEVYDANASTKELMTMFKENMPKPTPLPDMRELIGELRPRWVKLHHEKPAPNRPVICALMCGSTIEYATLRYRFDGKWDGGNDDDNGYHVVAWLKNMPMFEAE